MNDHDDELFARALDAQGPPPDAPATFADDVMKRWEGSRTERARTGRIVWGVALAAVLPLALGYAAFGSPREGEVAVAPEGGPRTVAIGRRAVAVFEPGTRARWRTGGWFGGDDTVEMREGAGFFRVDHGGGFVVRGAHGEARVTGTCFRVATTARGRDQAHGDETMRARWFGAGALSMAMLVAVYEGGVRVANADGSSVAVEPGQVAVVETNGAMRRGATHTPSATASAQPATSASATAGDAPGADPTAPNVNAPPPGANGRSAEAEVVRLRALLAQRGLSPENGEPIPNARRGLDDPGETDLTPDEWRTLAARGELRYRIPGARAGNDSVGDERARRLGIPEADRAEVNRVFTRAHERLMNTLRGLYREAASADPAGLSMEALCNEIRDKAPEDVLGRVNYQLSQERGGVIAWQPPRADMPPYERMMRALVSYEREIESELAPVVGDRIAHDILHGENQVSAHSYGLTGRPSDAGR